MLGKKNGPPAGKFAGIVKVGERGQIVIPKGARDLMGIEPGETLVLLADVKRGIALVKNDRLFERFAGMEADDPEEENK